MGAIPCLDSSVQGTLNMKRNMNMKTYFAQRQNILSSGHFAMENLKLGKKIEGIRIRYKLIYLGNKMVRVPVSENWRKESFCCETMFA